MHVTFDDSHFEPLPGWAGTPGSGRRTGVELEFGDLTETRAAEIARELLGGRIAADGSDVLLEGSRIGTLKIYLDTRLRKTAESWLAKEGLDLGREIVPVEVVTEPLSQKQMPDCEALFAALAEAGASGTRGGVLLGFGLHLNPALADEKGADLPAVATAYALLEAWLRKDDPIDVSRRMLPFTDPYPAAYLDALTEGEVPDVAGFIDRYLDAVDSRNHGLDLLPIIAELAPDRFRSAHGEDKAVSPRPAYHYRLPDSRLGDPGWSLAYEWNRWVFVERVARDEDLLAKLRAAWRDLGWLASRTPGRWAERVDALLSEHAPRPELSA